MCYKRYAIKNLNKWKQQDVVLVVGLNFCSSVVLNENKAFS